MSLYIDELLEKVQNKEVEVFDLCLTDLAREFSSPPEDLYPGSRFIAGLAHLIYLKAKGLVPVEEEPTAEEETAAMRLQAVEEYATFRDVAKQFSSIEREQQESFWRPYVAPAEEMPRPFHLPLDLEEFSRLFTSIWQEAQDRQGSIFEEEWSVADALKIVRLALIQRRLSIHDLFPPTYSKEQLIVTFLAVLELLKHQEASLIKEQNIWYLICQQQQK